MKTTHQRVETIRRAPAVGRPQAADVRYINEMLRTWTPAVAAILISILLASAASRWFEVPSTLTPTPAGKDAVIPPAPAKIYPFSYTPGGGELLVEEANKARDAARLATDRAASNIQQTYHHAQDVKDTLSERVKGVSEYTSQGVRRTEESAKEWAADKQRWVEGQAAHARDWLHEKKEQVHQQWDGKAAADAYIAAKQAAHSALHERSQQWVGGRASADAYAAAKMAAYSALHERSQQWAKQMREQAKDTLHIDIGSPQETLHQAWDQAMDFATDTLKGLDADVETTQHKLQETWEQVKDIAADKLKGMDVGGDTLREVINTAEDKLQEKWEQAKGMAEGFDTHKVEETWEQAKDIAGGRLREAVGGAEEKLQETWEKAKDLASDTMKTVDSLESTLQEKVEQARDIAGSTLREVIDTTQEKVGLDAETLARQAQHLATEAKNVLSEATTAAQTQATQTYDTAKEMIPELLQEAKHMAGDVLERVKDASPLDMFGHPTNTPNEACDTNAVVEDAIAGQCPRDDSGLGDAI